MCKLRDYFIIFFIIIMMVKKNTIKIYIFNLVKDNVILIAKLFRRSME